MLWSSCTEGLDILANISKCLLYCTWQIDNETYVHKELTKFQLMKVVERDKKNKKHSQDN